MQLSALWSHSEPTRVLCGSLIHLGLLEAIDVVEVLIVSSDFHLELIGSFGFLGVWSALFLRSIVSLLLI